MSFNQLSSQSIYQTVFEPTNQWAKLYSLLLLWKSWYHTSLLISHLDDPSKSAKKISNIRTDRHKHLIYNYLPEYWCLFINELQMFDTNDKTCLVLNVSYLEQSIYLFIKSNIYLFIYMLIHYMIHLFIHPSFICSFIHSLTHSLFGI